MCLLTKNLTDIERYQTINSRDMWEQSDKCTVTSNRQILENSKTNEIDKINSETNETNEINSEINKTNKIIAKLMKLMKSTVKIVKTMKIMK